VTGEACPELSGGIRGSGTLKRRWFGLFEEAKAMTAISRPVATRRYRLSGEDALFIYADSADAPLHIGWIATLEGRLDFKALVRSIERRLQFVPRYRQRLMPVPFNLSHAMMEDAPDFRIQNHMFRHPMPRGTSQADAIQEILRYYEPPLDLSRPLWEIHSFEGLEGGRTAVMSKVHHALVDGVSGVELLKVMFDLKPKAPEIPAPPRWQPEPSSSVFERLLGALSERTRFDFQTLRESLRDWTLDPHGVVERAKAAVDGARTAADLVARSIVSTPWNSGLVSQRRSLAWSRHSFAEFRAIREAFGGSINDVVLAVLTEGAARYLKHHGYGASGKEFCVGCPVNVRHTDERSTLGNRVSMIFPRMPAEPIDVVERLHRVIRETAQIKESATAQKLEMLMTLLGAVPPALTSAAAGLVSALIETASALVRLSGYTASPDGFIMPPRLINFIATNVPGVQVPLYVLGQQCIEQIPLTPIAATMGYAVAILSYNQNMYFGMVADPHLLPDIGLMKFFVDEAFVELKKRCVSQGQASRTAQVAAMLAS
jgi:diacylglycerol O-acyltransferase / wax synthase